MNSKQDEIQKEVVNKMTTFFKSNDKGYLDLSPRFGKCKVTIDWLKAEFDEEEDDVEPFVLIVYPNNTIKESWENEMKLWGYHNFNVVLVNFRSLEKYIHHKHDVFIIDEFHEATSDREMEACRAISKSSGKTLALSGTISKDTKKRWPEFKEIANFSISKAVDQNVIADYFVTVHKVKLDNTIKTPNSKGRMLTEQQKYDNLTYVIEKMKFEGNNYMHLALQRNRLSSSSIGKREFTKKLLKELQNKRTIVFTGLTEVADSLGIPTYHSKSPSDENLKAFQEGRINQLGLAESGKLGVTFFKLDCVILLNTTHNSEATAQSVLRSVKLDYQEKIADIRLIILDEEPEIKKVKESLSMLDPKKIKYV